VRIGDIVTLATISGLVPVMIAGELWFGAALLTGLLLVAATKEPESVFEQFQQGAP